MAGWQPELATRGLSERCALLPLHRQAYRVYAQFVERRVEEVADRVAARDGRIERDQCREVEDVREVEEEVAPGFSLGEEVREIEKDEPITEEEKVENEEEDSLVPLVESDPLNNEEVVLDDPAPQVSPDETPVDPLVQDDGGILAEQPSEPVSNP